MPPFVKRRHDIGTTSFIHPAGWLENARRLAGRVDDVELLLFDPSGPGGLPDAAELAGLARVAREAELTYTVHAPLDVALGSEDAARRKASVARVLEAARATAPLHPRALVVHLVLGERKGGPPPADVAAWQRRAIESFEAILAGGVAPETLCLESLDYDFALAEPVLEPLGLSAALDVGHLARDGRPFDDLLERNLGRARVVQLHGTEPGGRDHRSLRHYPRADAVRLVRTLAREEWDGVLTLEVFGEADLEDSLACLAAIEAEALA
jgi:sugar phosphate isomerase/epimerase